MSSRDLRIARERFEQTVHRLVAAWQFHVTRAQLFRQTPLSRFVRHAIRAR